MYLYFPIMISLILQNTSDDPIGSSFSYDYVSSDFGPGAGAQSSDPFRIGDSSPSSARPLSYAEPDNTAVIFEKSLPPANRSGERKKSEEKSMEFAPRGGSGQTQQQASAASRTRAMSKDRASSTGPRSSSTNIRTTSLSDL